MKFSGWRRPLAAVVAEASEAERVLPLPLEERVREPSHHAPAERLLTRELAQRGVQPTSGSVGIDRAQTVAAYGRASFEHGITLGENIAKVNSHSP